MNRKTLTLIIIGALVVLLGILLALANLGKKPETAVETSTVITLTAETTPVLIQSADGSVITPVITGESALRVIKSVPPDNATSVSSSIKLDIQFNKPFDVNTIYYTIDPEVPYTLSTENSILKVRFSKPLAESTVYTYKITTKESFPRTYSFTTYGTAPVKQPNTYPVGAAKIEDDFNKVNNPDIFVASRSPHEEATFALDKQYNENTRRFDFVVNSRSDQPRAEAGVQAWLTEIGLSGDAIASLKITYK